MSRPQFLFYLLLIDRIKDDDTFYVPDIIMKKKLPIIITFISLAFSAFQGITLGDETQVRYGYIDFSEHSLKNTGVSNLDGYWEFYWDSLLTPSDFSGGSAPVKTGYIKLPGPWNWSEVNGITFPPRGYATFRAVILLHKDDLDSILHIDMPFVHSAYKLYIDGVPAAGNGITGKSALSMKPAQIPEIVPFKPSSEKIEIVLQISNFQQRCGGLLKHIKIGREKDISERRDIRLAILLMVIGCIITISIFHLSIAAYKPRDRSNLYFGLFSVFITLRLLLIDDKIMNQMFNFIPWALTFRLEYITIPAASILFILFIQFRIREQISSLAVRIIIFYELILIMLAVFSPVFILSRLVLIFQSGMILGIIYILYCIIKITLKDRRFALLYFFGIASFFASVISDIFVTTQSVQEIYTISLGFLIFIITQSVISLQQSIDEQNRLKSLEKELEIAEKIQRSLLPAKIPEILNIDLSYKYVPRRGVGGDFIDIKYNEDEKKLGLFICDVSGHGIAAALTASMVSKTLDFFWEPHFNSPSLLFSEMSGSLKDKMGSNFFTGCICIIDIKNGSFKMANAGHPPLLIIRKNGSVEMQNGRGKLISSYFESNCEDKDLQLNKGDILVLYTDGITEAENSKNERIGFESDNEFAEWVKKYSDMSNSSAELCENIYHAVVDIKGDENLDDDLTLIILKYR